MKIKTNIIDYYKINIPDLSNINSIDYLKKQNQEQKIENDNLNYTIQQMEKEYNELIDIVYEYQQKLQN